MTSLTPSDIRILEQTRQRLSQLTESLNALNRDIHTSHPLPSWTSLTTRFTILSTNLHTLSTLLHKHAATLDHMSVFPLPRFPSAQENLLGLLLRKRLEPGVEEWVEEGGMVGDMVAGIGGGGGGGRGGGGDNGDGGGEEGEKGMQREEWRELWEWGPVRANEEARGYEWFTGEYTREEREVGGMDVDGGEEEEEEEKEDGDGARGEDERVEGGVAKTVKMEDLLRFMSTGIQPS
ncbi:mediator of RNA polymerase II transcription subunit 8 [Xanthoria calcicola]